MSVNYYDNYDFISNFANDSLAYRDMTGYDSKYTGLISAQSAKGLLTGTATRVLGDTTMLVKSLYYDCHGNVIQSHESNAVGGYEHDYYHLTFTGKPLAVRHEHSTGTAHHVDINTMTYDAMERLLTTTVTHDGEQVDVISNTYDDLGRLVSQSCLNNQQTTTYSYNIRNWITQIYAGIDAHSFPVMKQSLHYADAVTGSTPCFNGNISAMDWNTLSHYAINRYCYSYDGMNRLTQAGHMVYSPNADLVFDIPECYSTSYSYDLNSNITSLTRHGKSEQYTSLGSVFYNYGLIDNLSITRDGNRLKKVTDYCDELTYAGAMDFKDGANEQVEYTWDANGNMTSDLNKGISEIKYNILNLPEKITHNNGHITYITYGADGRKLRVTYKINPLIAIGDPVIHPGEPVDPIGPLSMLPANELNGNGGSIPLDPQPVSIERVIMTRDYCGAYTYRNGAIERILMGNGFMQDSAYYVQVKDYQGNVRAVLDQNHNVVERNDYYPYGGLINASDSQLQPYKYSSKELDRENGLDLYDSQARWYDPMLPQTTTQDPLAEKYYSISPYTWCAGNPVRIVDYDGKDIILIVWASYNGEIGHAGIAISNYKKEIYSSRVKGQVKKQTRMVKDGTYTYRDLWPSESIGKRNFNSNVKAHYNHRKVTMSELLNTDVTYSERRQADGVIKISSTYESDQRIHKTLDTYEDEHVSYNSLTNNCSDYAEVALEEAANKQLPVDEKLSSRVSATTPNQLFKAAKTIKGNKVLKDPGNLIEDSFIRAVTGGELKQNKAEDKLNR